MVRTGDGGWKRVALDSNEGRICIKERLLVCENGDFLRTVIKGGAEGRKGLLWVAIRKGLCERTAFCT